MNVKNESDWSAGHFDEEQADTTCTLSGMFLRECEDGLAAERRVNVIN